MKQDTKLFLIGAVIIVLLMAFVVIPLLGNMGMGWR